MIITIDGAVGTGKSSVAKALARDLGFIYVDTGAMYRCITYAILKHHIDINDSAALTEFLKNFQYSVKIKLGERFYFVENEDVTLKIRSAEITNAVSKISALPAVRENLVALQRRAAVGVNGIFEGRDMGTVVFPDAQLKIFLTGSPEVRAARRFKELREKFPEDTENLTVEEVLKDINARDDSDSTRAISPLKQASDCCVVDTSNLTIDDVVLKILEFKDTIRARQATSH